jgi:release factor glutamine methyltransferase
MADATQDPWTVLRLLDWMKEYFARNELESPRLAAEILLAHVVGCSRIELYTRFDHEPSKAQLQELRQLVRRAATHEPVGYLVGSKEFYSLTFEVTQDVLIPRPESEILVDQTLELIRNQSRTPQVLDACSGSGCVGIAIARNCEPARVLCTDVSPQAVEVARRNAEKLDVSDRVSVRVADCLEIPDDCADFLPLDVITANPPYVKEGDWVAPVVKHEPHVALYSGGEGMDVIRGLVAGAPDRLAPGGALIMEFGYDQAQAVDRLVAENQAYDYPRCRLLEDHQNIERVIIAVTRSDETDQPRSDG